MGRKTGSRQGSTVSDATAVATPATPTRRRVARTANSTGVQAARRGKDIQAGGKEATPTPFRIALTGPALSGKTTLARYLERHHSAIFVAYNDVLKVAAADALSHLGIATTKDSIIADKQRYRPFLQELGELLGFNEGWGLEYMVKGIPNFLPVVLDNVRFAAQWELLKPHGFTLVRLHFTSLQQYERAESLGLSTKSLGKAMQHPAEAGIPAQEGEIRLEGVWSTEAAARVLLEELYARRTAAES